MSVEKRGSNVVKSPEKQAKGGKNTKLITEAQLRRMPKKAYMDDEQLAFFRQRLLDLRVQTEEHIEQLKSELTKEDREIDENVQASIEENRTMILRIIDRESKLLPKILYSLQQIEDKTYGYCEETGEEIGIERLLLRPTARLSITAKNYQEEKEREYSDE
jgi:RNA polymerase-binding transcription factor